MKWLVLSAITASVAAAASDTPQTMRQCAELLPKGRAYTFSFTGTIDTKGAQPRLSAALEVSDGTTENRQQDGAAFAQCVSKLVR
jgi:hypothetical protein